MLLQCDDTIELHCGEKFDVNAYSFLKGVIEEANQRNCILPAEQCKDVYIINSSRLIHYVNCFAATAGYKILSQSNVAHAESNKVGRMSVSMCVTMVKED